MSVTDSTEMPNGAAALRNALCGIVGQDHVSGPAAARDIADPYGFGAAPSAAGDLVVRPRLVGEVQGILRVAHDHDIPIWTVSRGRNLGYGGASPRQAGGIIVDLSRMDRILAVDESSGAVIVEPGVTFLQLHAHLRATGSRLWISTPDIGWGSVIGNTLERGFGYAAHGDHSAAQCGMEVVLADGSLVRTGMGAKAGSPTWPLYKGGFGPSLDGLFFQSNLGIVTKMGVWLMPAPEQAAACMIRISRDEDLGEAIETLRPFLLDATIQSPVVVGNATVIASMIADRASWWMSPEPMSDNAIAAMAGRMGLGLWNARFGLYGPTEVVAAKIAVIRRALAHRLPSTIMSVAEYPGDVAPEEVHPADRAQLGIPSVDLIRMAAWRGGEAAHLDFSVICPSDGASVASFIALLRGRVESHGFDYAGGVTIFPRHAIALALVSFDKAKSIEAGAIRSLFPELIAVASAAGGASYRAHIEHMDLIAEQYDFGDFALRRLQERLKDALDPAGLLSPGKQGIWPSKSRISDRTDR